MRRKISEVMRPRALVELPATASAHRAAMLMCENNVDSVLVTDRGRLEGIFTERDLVCRVVAQGREPDATPLGDVMTRNPDTVGPNALALDALHMMGDGGYRHLPVIADGRPIGVVSRRDFAGLEKAQLDNEDSLWQRL